MKYFNLEFIDINDTHASFETKKVLKMVDTLKEIKSLCYAFCGNDLNNLIKEIKERLKDY